MTQTPPRGAKPRLADSGEIEQTDQKIADVVERLDQLGKSPADVISLFERLESEGFESFDLSKAEWSATQVWTALELMCLCTFRTVQTGDLHPDPIALTTIALLYGDVIQQRAYRIFAGMLPDYERGSKSSERAPYSRSTPAERDTRRERVQKINHEVCLDWVKRRGAESLKTLTRKRQCKLIADKYQKRHGEPIDPKTVERDLRKSPRIEHGSKNGR
jgi:hypothetical protein